VTGYSLPLRPNLFPIIGIVTVAVQLVVSFIVFKKIQDEEGFTATISWASGGFVIIILLIPFAIQYLL